MVVVDWSVVIDGTMIIDCTMVNGGTVFFLLFIGCRWPWLVTLCT